MANTNTVVVPEQKVEVVSQLPWHSVRLNNDVAVDGERLMPRGCDITELKLVDVPECLMKVHVYGGGGHLMTIERKDFCDGKNVFPEGFPLSLAWGFYIDLKFVYDDAYVLANEVSKMVDEYEEVVEQSDTEEEFYDSWSNEYHHGYRVHRRQVPTGRKVSEVVEGAKVSVPQMDFVTVKSERDRSEQFILRVWEDITIDPARDDEPYLMRLKEKYKLHMADGSCVFEALKAGKPFKAKVENMIRFNDGFVGKVFCF